MIAHRPATSAVLDLGEDEKAPDAEEETPDPKAEEEQEPTDLTPKPKITGTKQFIDPEILLMN